MEWYSQNLSPNWTELYPHTHTHTQHGSAQWKSITFPFDLLFKSENYYYKYSIGNWLSGGWRTPIYNTLYVCVLCGNERTEVRKTTEKNGCSLDESFSTSCHLCRSKNSNSPNSKIEWSKKRNIFAPFPIFNLPFFVFQSPSKAHTHAPFACTLNIGI